ncbi:hypothetical protein A9Q84_13410 [Halobacteriovorax marinus]|uniref:histidine kinase n=1 Tax=Halobacteriovorax marinus TaxID=97084 RepID=A0A1Y5F8P6_9BACT|nr:hypothetical protein A9Q84_13410 [Halobacteriovorax marinus]
MVLNGFLYLKNRNTLYKQIFGLWATSLGVFLLGGVFQQHPLGVTLSFGLSVIPVVYFIFIHAKAIRYKYEIKLFSFCFLFILTPLTIFLFFKGYAPYIVGLPLTLGNVYVIGKYIFLIKRYRYNSLTFAQKLYFYGLVYAMLIQATFPISTLSPALSLMGWSLAFTIYVLFSITLPSFVLESIHLSEEKRLNDVVDLRTEELRSTLSDKESLFRTIIHDINNPLNTIMLSLEMYTELDGVKKDRVVSRAFKHVKLVHGIIEDVTAKYMEMVEDKISICSLQECFSMSHDIFAEKLNEKNISLRLICSGKSDYILNVDKISFVTSVLNNLISNAIKFSFDNSEIQVIASEVDGEITIEVKDFGSGMNKIKVNSLLNETLQTSTSGTSGEMGLGLGFNQVKHYVESLAGSIELSSKEQSLASSGSGTSVKMFFDRYNLSGTTSETDSSTIQ